MKTLKEVLDTFDNTYPEIDWKQTVTQSIMLSITFIIPTFNSAKTISTTLRSIAQQDLPTNKIEVIVVDDNSDDDTKQVVSEFIKEHNLNIVYVMNDKRSYAAACRNVGILKAKGDIICFLDSDIIIPQDFLRFHLSLHQKYSNIITLSLRSFIDKKEYDALDRPFPILKYMNEFRIAVTGKKNIHEENVEPPHVVLPEYPLHLYEESNGFRRIKGNNFFWTLPELCLTHSICYKREDLLLVKGAPENFKGWGYNDTSMAAKVITLGRKVIPILEAGVYHINHPSRTGSAKLNSYFFNKIKYEKMIQLDQQTAYQYYIPELDE